MDHNVTHATFTLERSYPVPPAWREQGTADQLEALAGEPARRRAGRRHPDRPAHRRTEEHQ